MKDPFSTRRRGVFAAMFASFVVSLTARADDTSLARKLVEHIDTSRGLCAVLGIDGTLPLDIARDSELLVHVRDPNAPAVGTLRDRASEAGLGISRLVAEAGSLDALPHADNTVDLVLSARAGGEFLKTLAASEILRALRPEGIAVIGGAGPGGDPGELDRALLAWLENSPAEDIEQWKDEHGAWISFAKPALEGADEWSHWEKSPDNNPVSRDAHILAPYMTQYMATPWYIGMPAITTASGGRTFLAVGHIAHHEREWEMLGRIIARNGYNGIVLWERKLPDNYLVHSSAFVATPDTFHMMNGDHSLLLDARTGEEKGTIRIPGLNGQWKWMAHSEGILYVLAGEPEPGVELVKGTRAMGGWSWADLSKGYYEKRIPHGFGDQIAAFDIEKGKVLWTHHEDSLIDSRGLAIRDGRFLLYCPDKHLRALDDHTGKELWTVTDPETLTLIEEPGKGLTSTPGWRTQTLIVATPNALVIQGQTLMNVIAISPTDGRLLWTRKKITNNPNAIFIDGTVIVGVGPGGANVALDPVSGEEVENLGFVKRACTRLTASTDSLFCRGEGMTRFDLEDRKVTIDGAVRPACNDGVIPANGLLYLGPWSCDCNLSLIGNVARCSAGDFSFARTSTSAQLERAPSNDDLQPFAVDERDWSTYRARNDRSASSAVPAKPLAVQRWHSTPERASVPTEATAAGGLLFMGGDDGIVRAIDRETGSPVWTFRTAGVIKYPPTIANDRAYIGSGDGHTYCLEAATGHLLWRFRAAPQERQIMIYGNLSSTWPVITGILIHDNVACFGAGIVDHDGTYITALDATTGKLLWQNTTSGHLNPELRKGVSAQGNLSIRGDALLLAGGNVVSPARFDLATGASLDEPRTTGAPQSNAGKFIGVYGDGTIIAGGRILHSSPRNVATKGSFDIWPASGQRQTLTYGGIPPAWDKDLLVVANFKYGKLTVFSAETLTNHLGTPAEIDGDKRNAFNNTLFRAITARAEEEWQIGLGDLSEFEPVSLLIAPNAIIAVARYQDMHSAKPQWFVTSLRRDNGQMIAQQVLPGEPLPGGLLIDRDGNTVVTLLDGGLVSYGSQPGD